MAVTWEDRRKLMRDYFDELQMIDGKPLLSDKQQDMLFARHVKEVQDGYGAWIDINCEDELVGFLLLSKHLIATQMLITLLSRHTLCHHTGDRA